MLGKIKIETPKNLYKIEFICLWRKAYSYKCNDKTKNKPKSISQVK